MDVHPRERGGTELAHAPSAVELEEPADDVRVPFGVRGRSQERERVPIPAPRQGRDVRTEGTLVVLRFFEAEGVTHIGS